MAEAKENGNTLTIDGVAHDADSFSDEGKQQFVELSIVEEKLKLSNQRYNEVVVDLKSQNAAKAQYIKNIMELEGIDAKQEDSTEEETSSEKGDKKAN
jgi:major membrane immunogen (membrane-anchored lipoprotein)|tara:strand:+ start:118 stop:411 length:294 start_codon:yes stop_codon:yes gene_type:complete